MNIAKTIFQRINQGWSHTKTDFIIKAGSFIQNRLNTQSPPGKNRKILENNTMDYTTTNSVTLNNKNGKINCGPFNQGIFRVYLRDNSAKTSWHEHNSWAVDLTNTEKSGWEISKKSDTTVFTYSLANQSKAKLKIDALKGSISVQIGQDSVMADLLPPQAGQEWICVQKHLLHPGDVHIFGLGENTHPMNKAGQKITMWNSDRSNYKKGTNPLYQSWPVVVFQYSEGPAFGLVFDNPSYSVFDCSLDGKKIDYAVQDNELNYYILLGPTLPEVMKQLSILTGKLTPLPKWSLGYQQSRWSYMPSARVREVAAEFRKRDIPCDTIYLDIDYMEKFKCFTWGKDFEDYKKLVKELHAQGFKIVPIIDPGLKIEKGYPPYDAGIKQGMFITDGKGKPVTRKVWAGSSHFPDFINSRTRAWWGELMQEFIKSGVDGIWCDMNEPSTFDCRRTLPGNVMHKISEKVSMPHKKVHNIYGLMMSKATHQGLRKTTQLPYVITRSSYLGGQKYAVTWTGDNGSDWEHFRASIPMILNLGLSGQPISGPDIGGFKGTPPAELYERWILQGALYPFSRSHTGQGTKDQEPWSFGEEVEKSARMAIKLRYRLIPYMYSLLYEASQNGQPVMRPIFYHTPTGEALKPEHYETEFMLGPHLLVAPLMDRASTRSCYIPPGKWYSWWCREERIGGQNYKTTNSDTTLPLFVKENAIIPLYPKAPSFVPNKSLESLEILITVNDRAEGTIVDYFDQESIFAYQVQATAKQDRLAIKIDLQQEGSIPKDYHPPQTLHMLLNRQISDLQLHSIHQGYSLLPDSINKTWTRITIHAPVFPFRGEAISDLVEQAGTVLTCS